MKNIGPKIIEMFKSGYCSPDIIRIARKIKEPSTTIHYNIKKLENEKIIKTYKAIFDYNKINEGHCVYVMINLLPEKYDSPEEVGKEIAKDPKVESVDICTGEYELIVKVRTKDIEEYYKWIKNAIKKYGLDRTYTLTSLKQLKTEFVEF
jgi:Lrp/AsnC family transcriptional regulator, leucine-responsive regulatory protein